jgi:hypothetical protein
MRIAIDRIAIKRAESDGSTEFDRGRRMIFEQIAEQADRLEHERDAPVVFSAKLAQSVATFLKRPAYLPRF